MAVRKTEKQLREEGEGGEGGERLIKHLQKKRQYSRDECEKEVEKYDIVLLIHSDPQ